MALTSDKLKEMTRRKLGLVKEIDKNPSDNALRIQLAALEMEIKNERTKIITDDAELAVPKAAVAAIPAIAVPATPKAEEKNVAEAGSAASKAGGTKKLSDYF